MKLVRYQNRKYYSPDLARYVTAPEIIEMVKHGIAVTIQCHKTRNDITAPHLVHLLAKNPTRALTTEDVVTLIRRSA